MYWAIKRLWFPVAMQLLWWGGRQIDWPRPLQLAGCVLAMIAIASSAQYLTYAPRHLEDGYRWVEITVLSVGRPGLTHPDVPVVRHPHNPHVASYPANDVP